MANAEYQRLDKTRPRGAAGDGLKLLLKIAAKSEFLTKSRGEGQRYPREALKKPLGKKSLSGIRSFAQDMRIHQADPDGPERCAQSDVFHHVFRSCPAAADKIAQTDSALVYAHADIEHQQPFKDEHRNVTGHGVATRHSCLWVLDYGVLKETAHDGQTYKKCNEHDGMPRWGNERAAH